MGYGMFAPLPKYKFDADEPPIVATWSGLGVCALAVEAVVKNYPDCLEGLLSLRYMWELAIGIGQGITTTWPN